MNSSEVEGQHLRLFAAPRSGESSTGPRSEEPAFARDLDLLDDNPGPLVFQSRVLPRTRSSRGETMIISTTNQFDKALMVSLTAHSGRLDKAGLPCILHPLRIAAKFPGNEAWGVIALLHDVVGDTFDTYGQITLPDIQTEFGEQIAIRVGALTRRRPGMLYRSHELDAPGAVEWKIATETEDYLQDYIPRVCQFSASREIKIEDLYDDLDPRRFHGLRTDEAESRDQRYYRALEILLASPMMTRLESLDGRDPAGNLASSEGNYGRTMLALSK
jgi:hypothetical protein